LLLKGKLLLELLPFGYIIYDLTRVCLSLKKLKLKIKPEGGERYLRKVVPESNYLQGEKK